MSSAARDFLGGFGIGQGLVLVGGAWAGSASRELDRVLDPSDEAVIDLVAKGCAEDVDRAVAAARKALPGWMALTPMERAGFVGRLAALVEENAAPLARVLTAEGGKVLAQSAMEVGAAVQQLRFAAENARRIQGEILPGDSRGEQIWIQRVPFGVVACITAWNFPAALFARKIGPALVAGNTVVAKPHELTPLATLVMGELARRAGMPEGVLNIVTGNGLDVGARLVSHPDVALVTMTGSTRAGSQIYAAGAPDIKPVRLELGGKAPFLALEDADVDKAVASAVGSKFFAGGAVCTCNDRMYVHARIYDEFVEKFIAATAALKVGDPMGTADIGPRVSRAEVDKLRKMAEQAKREGARPLFDGTPAQGAPEKGYWSFPMVFEVASNELAIMREETFGPIAAIMRIDDFEQGLAYANASDHGLSAFVFTNDNRRIMRCVNELNFGEIYINRAMGESVHGFHTGYGKSGLGGEDGMHGFEGYLRKKTMYNHYG